MNEEYWKAIVECNGAFDGRFYYGVASTRIYCLPSCRSKTPKKEHTRIFATAEEARESGFRACKRCRPDYPIRYGPDGEMAIRVTELIESEYDKPLTLDRLAEVLHTSSSHLHRTFRRVTGMTPAEYLRNIRIQTAVEKLKEPGLNITDIALATGFRTASHFTTVFRESMGYSPSEYRQLHKYAAANAVEKRRPI